MENNSRTILSDTWLKPVIGLVEEGDFEEAYALAEYLPVTPGKRLVQCTALLGQKKVSAADEILQELPVKMPEVLGDFATILGKDGFDFLEVGLEAIRDEHLDLGHLCLESHLSIHPESVQAVVDGMVELASQAFKTDDSNLGWGSQ